MDTEIAARVTALELLVANLIAERLRTTAEPGEMAALALQRILGQVNRMGISGPPAITSTFSTAVGDAAGRVMEMAVKAIE